MSLPNFRMAAVASSPMASSSPAQPLRAGAPVAFNNILKERLRATVGGVGVGGATLLRQQQEELRNTPFAAQGSHGSSNNAFNPQRLGSRTSGVSKPPKAPEKPLMPYLRFSRSIWESVRSAHPDLKLWELGKVIGQKWRELSDAEKQEYSAEYEADKVEYEKAMALYRASPGYQAYMQAKSHGEPIVDDPDPRPSTVLLPQERRIDIQPAEDENDFDDGLSVKHIAHARFTRNHRLINEIFGEVIMPDVRSVFTTTRMQVLKRQIQSLTMHQKKLETELVDIEDKFVQKKQKFLDSSADFQQELKRQRFEPVDDERFKQMVADQITRLKRERDQAAGNADSSPATPPASTGPEQQEQSTRRVVQQVEKDGEESGNQDSPMNGQMNGSAEKSPSDSSAPQYADMAPQQQQQRQENDVAEKPQGTSSTIPPVPRGDAPESGSLTLVEGQP